MKTTNLHAVPGMRLIIECLLMILLTFCFGAARADVTVVGDVTPDPSLGSITGPVYIGSTLGDGSVTFFNAATFSSQGAYLGAVSGTTGTAIVSEGSVWTTVPAACGGSSLCSFFSIGLAPGSTGNMLVTGANSKAGGAGNATNVGLNGTGSLTINDGGAFEALFINVGRTNGAIGTMTVDGAASSVLLSGSDGTSGAFLTVGREGGSQGTADFTNGAQINIQNFADSQAAGFNVGRSSGSNGTINVSGGAAINVTGIGSATSSGAAANIGRGGTGVLNVFAGGTVSLTSSTGNANARIGYQGGNGTATIDGIGSQLIVQSSAGLARVLVGDGASSPGTLDVRNGGMVSAQEVVVNANGILTGGGGFIDALVTVNGGILAPGNSPGTMTIDGDLTFNSGILEIEIAALSSDFLHVTGAASFLAGTFAFSFLDGFLPTSGSSWLFLTADGGITGWEGLNLAVSGLNSDYSWFISRDGNNLNFNVSSVAAVPEPEIYAMMGIGLALMGWVGRRRKQQVA